jgi:hypothetical protein
MIQLQYNTNPFSDSVPHYFVSDSSDSNGTTDLGFVQVNHYPDDCSAFVYTVPDGEDGALASTAHSGDRPTRAEAEHVHLDVALNAVIAGEMLPVRGS